MQRKKTIKKLGSIFIVALFFQTSFSQKNYLPGYVIKPAGDTLRGFIDYRDKEENPNKINFKEKLENSHIEYKPMNIIEFSVLDEIYVSGAINSETSPFETERLQEDPTLHLKADTTFLQTLFKGDKCLYYYKSPEGKENFYIKQNAAFELLMYKRYLKNQEGTLVIAENKKYLGQLFVYLNNCQTIQSKIEGLEYQKKAWKIYSTITMNAPIQQLSSRKKPRK